MNTFTYHLVPVRPNMSRGGPDPDEALIINEHFRYLKQLCDDGVVLTAGRTNTVDEHTFGIVIFKAEAESTVGQVMRKDLATRRGIMRVPVSVSPCPVVRARSFRYSMNLSGMASILIQ